jgi:hypothetical protein
VKGVVEASLAEQRQSLLGQLRLQREVIAQQLAPAENAQKRFPRSFTMRFLIQRPELATRLATLVAGGRVGSGVSVTLEVVKQLARR